MTPQAFVDTYLPYANQASKNTGLDPAVILTQWAVETGYGGTTTGNNLAGIKNSQWNVASTGATTSGGFATFNSFSDFVKEYSNWMGNFGNYAPVRAAIGLSPKAQLQAIALTPWDADHYHNGNDPWGTKLFNTLPAIQSAIASSGLPVNATTTTMPSSGVATAIGLGGVNGEPSNQPAPTSTVTASSPCTPPTGLTDIGGAFSYMSCQLQQSLKSNVQTTLDTVQQDFQKASFLVLGILLVAVGIVVFIAEEVINVKKPSINISLKDLVKPDAPTKSTPTSSTASTGSSEQNPESTPASA